ncbi:ORF6N domain-containing protein [Filifactor villosus]|uniref:ORF6N domain-containing protein n=1 Tax=Filifactor villosus TaxID=29374 RepID=A0ABV9QRE3_9FIRM
MKDENTLMPIDETNITDMIYTIRGKQVMIDSDLASLYHVTTGNLNKAMKRNVARFPERFCFQLTEVESQVQTVLMAAEDICLMHLQNKALRCFLLFLKVILQ